MRRSPWQSKCDMASPTTKAINSSHKTENLRPFNPFGNAELVWWRNSKFPAHLTRASCPWSTFKTCHIAKGGTNCYHAHFMHISSMPLVVWTIYIYLYLYIYRKYVVHLQSPSPPPPLEITVGATIDTISNTKSFVV